MIWWIATGFLCLAWIVWFVSGIFVDLHDWLQLSPLLIVVFVILLAIMPVAIQQRQNRLRDVRPYLGETIYPREKEEDRETRGF